MLKRFIDILFSLVGLVFLIPLFLLIAVFILLDDGPPVFFKQKRVGKNMEEFFLYKFRSMRKNNAGLSVTAGNDPRITKTGLFIRKYKLDEFPQLINVLLGQMSLVGPRPEVMRYVEMYDDEQRKVLSVKPGITGVDSLKFSHEEELLKNSNDPENTYINKIMPAKLTLSLNYVENQSLGLDFIILIKTLRKIFT